MHDLTQRQIEILKSLIEEYIETAEPVGSETLEKKHNLSASPATIRNEMVRLTELGYLKKPHTSAGRIPTSVGMKFYVKQLMKSKELSVADEVAVKEKLWDYREKGSQFMRELTKSLADQTKTVALVMTEDGDFYSYGSPYIFEMPEFFDIDVTKNLFSALDEFECLLSLCSVNAEDEDAVHVLLGDELGPKLSGPYGFVFTHYQTSGHHQGSVGVIGPARLSYTDIVPRVKYYGGLIEEIAKGW